MTEYGRPWVLGFDGAQRVTVRRGNFRRLLHARPGIVPRVSDLPGEYCWLASSLVVKSHGAKREILTCVVASPILGTFAMPRHAPWLDGLAFSAAFEFGWRREQWPWVGLLDDATYEITLAPGRACWIEAHVQPVLQRDVKLPPGFVEWK